MDFYVALHSLFIISIFSPLLRTVAAVGEVQTEPLVAVTVGETATLPCTFDKTQLVSLSWLRGENVETAETIFRFFRNLLRESTSDERFNTTSDYSLVLSGSRESDSDTYWCQVTLQGLFRSSTNLSVSPGPDSNIDPLTSVLPLSASTPHTTVKPTPGQTPTAESKAPTKPAPEKQTSPPKSIFIIVGVIGGFIVLALLVLVGYCCCCKRKAPDGYDKPKPV